MKTYVIKYGALYLAARLGWGPTFTGNIWAAKKFQAQEKAEAYFSLYLSTFDCHVEELTEEAVCHEN